VSFGGGCLDRFRRTFDQRYEQECGKKEHRHDPQSIGEGHCCGLASSEMGEDRDRTICCHCGIGESLVNVSGYVGEPGIEFRPSHCKSFVQPEPVQIRPAV
jgi:hypothetical protein